MSTARTLEVDAHTAGERLDACVAAALDVTRGYARRLLARGRVSLEGRPARKGTLLRAGDRIRVGAFRHPREGLLAAPGIPVRVLREAHGLVAIDKPAGLPTHPLDFDETATAANAFLAHYPQARQVGGDPLEPGLVHRLDTHTSGVLLFATTDPDWERARDAFRQGTVRKLYLARVHGAWTEPLELRLELAHRGPRMRVVERGGQPTHTRIRPLETRPDASLVEVDLRTGVRHQIRASLAHLGHPVVGDTLYGSEEVLGRHLLHAWSLTLDDFEACAPPPPELAARTDAPA